MKILSQNLATSLANFGSTKLATGAREQRASTIAKDTRAVESNRLAIKDTLEVSSGAQAQLTEEDAQATNSEGAAAPYTESRDTATVGKAKPSSASAPTTGDLSEEEQEVVDELKSIDREVRTHEQAHIAAAGGHARGGPTYSYEQGPDGQQYAVGGEVAIDTSPVSGDPEATIEKARTVRRAALAPAEPSAQDRAVAAAATKLEAQATQELRELEETEATDGASTEGSPSTATQPSPIIEVIEAGQLLDLIG